MARFWLGVILLALLLVLGLWITTTIGSTQENIAGILEQAQEKILSGDLASGNALVQKAHAQWQKKWHQTASVIDHAPMDEADSLFAQLQAYGAAGQTEHMAAYCARLSMLIEAIGESQALTWWNLL